MINQKNLEVKIGTKYAFSPTIGGLPAPVVCTEIDDDGYGFGPNPDYPDKSDIKIIAIGDNDDLNDGTIFTLTGK